MTTDPDLRRPLLAMLRAQSPAPIVLQEWQVTAANGITGVTSGPLDVATVDGAGRIHGYEIKSAADSTRRLARQVALYGAVCDRVTIVCAVRHLDGVQRLVPAWWGVSVLSAGEIVERRAAQTNPSPSAYDTALLMWRTELAAVCKAHGLPRGSKFPMAHAVAGRPIDEVRRCLAAALRAREGWRRADGRWIHSKAPSDSAALEIG